MRYHGKGARVLVKKIQADGGDKCDALYHGFVESSGKTENKLSSLARCMFILGTFTFHSERVLGVPFEIVLFADDVFCLRISTCCEHEPLSRPKIGGRYNQFSVVRVNGSEPCHE